MNGWLFSITFRDRRLDSCYISISFEASVWKIPGHLRTLRRACPTHEGYHYWRPLLLVKGTVCSLRFSISIPNVFALIWTYLHCNLWVWSFQFTQIQLKLLMWDNFSNYKVLCMLSVSLSRMADSFQTLVSTDPPHLQIDMVWHSINSTLCVLERGIMGYFSILQAKWLMSE